MRFAQNLILTISGRFVLKGANLISIILISRILDASDFGLFGLVVSAGAIISAIGHLGVRQSGAQLLGSGSIELGQYYRASMLSSPLLLIVVLGSTYHLLYKANVPIDIFVSGTVWVITLTLVGWLQGAMLGLNDFSSFNLIESLPRALFAACLLVAWMFPSAGGGLSVTSLILLQSFLVATSVAFFIIRLSRRFDTPSQEVLDPSGNDAKDSTLTKSASDARILIESGVTFALAVLLVTSIDRVGVWSVQQAKGSEAAGNFFAALQANQILFEVAAAIGLVLFSDSTRAKSPGDAVARIAKISRLLLALLTVPAVIFALLAEMVCHLLFGRASADMLTAFVVLSIGSPLIVVTKIIYAGFSGTGDRRFGLVIYGVGFIVAICLNYILPGAGTVKNASLGVVFGYLAAFVCAISYLTLATATRPSYFLIARRSDFEEIWIRLSAALRRLYEAR
ncbi:oligosaccharide flippase family protein [Ideonella sp. 4Y11]|uniref:Oligosaccharide flippase family protein n=1 Tax=Ideonella aquatica TaxID=2824119 RepID=A0A941BR48_9BURK|nr:oligosaccharide flippase family protein [Ideonella aquatica]MBQ0959925.1 oligosaccharide flippase family protein [Ideonella aquatica]